MVLKNKKKTLQTHTKHIKKKKSILFYFHIDVWRRIISEMLFSIFDKENIE